MKWTIKVRLLVGCGVLVAVTAIACCIGWQQAAGSEHRISGIIKGNQADTTRLELVQQSVEDLLNARRGEKEFLLKKEQSMAQNVTNKVVGLKARLLDLSEKANDNEEKAALT